MEKVKHGNRCTAVDAYIAQARARNLSKATIEAYRWGLSYIGTPELPTEPEEIERILAYASGRLSQESVHNVHRYLGMFFRWANKRLGVPDPTVDVAAPRHPQLLPRALSGEDVRTLLDSCPTGRGRLLVLVPLDTGLRLSEVAALRKSDLAETVRVLGKGSKVREIPFSPDLVSQLRGLGDGRHIWMADDGAPLSRAGVKTAYRRLFAVSGVRGGAHSLRHTFATEYLRNGGDLYRLSRIMGHSSTRITERYLHLIVDDLVEEHRRISPALRYLR